MKIIKQKPNWKMKKVNDIPLGVVKKDIRGGQWIEMKLKLDEFGKVQIVENENFKPL